MPDLAFLTERPFAHRGLHDGNVHVWENTLSAFRRAIDAGYGIECDLHYAGDAIPVVFHDDDMERLCNIKGDVRTRTAGELGLMSIGGTADKVPTFRSLLKLVAGRVPLLVELKGREHDDDGFAASVLEDLEGYQGPLALMSFDRHVLKDLVELECPWPVGLTAEGLKPEQLAYHREAMALGLSFTSYCLWHLPNDFVTDLRAKSVPVLTWTVRSVEQAAHAYAQSDQITFEGFDPGAARGPA